MEPAASYIEGLAGTASNVGIVSGLSCHGCNPQIGVPCSLGSRGSGSCGRLLDSQLVDGM